MIRNTFDEDICQSSKSRQESILPDVTAKKENAEIEIPLKFKDDVAALENYVGGPLETGLSIELSLKQILRIIPRNRPRTDAYAALCKFLKVTMGIDLIIKSMKKNETKTKKE